MKFYFGQFLFSINKELGKYLQKQQYKKIVPTKNLIHSQCEELENSNTSFQLGAVAQLVLQP